MISGLFIYSDLLFTAVYKSILNNSYIFLYLLIDL
jgi:hypothetical protein